MNKLEFKIAEQSELGELTKFLQSPEIDNEFYRPLPQRDITIQERVTNSFSEGLWILAKNGNIVGCAALIPKGQLVKISTFALNPNYKKAKVMINMMKYGEDIARRKLNATGAMTDSWEGERIGILLRRYGFKQSDIYEDPSKRPVVYQKRII